MLKGVQHTGFITNNIEKLYEFYKKLPGVKVIIEQFDTDDDFIKKLSGYKDAKIRVFWIQIGENKDKPHDDLSTHRVEFIQYLNPIGKDFDLEINSSGNAHISILTDSIDEDYRNLSKQGVEFSCKPIDSPLEGWKVVYLKDPDGRIVELMQAPTN